MDTIGLVLTISIFNIFIGIICLMPYHTMYTQVKGAYDKIGDNKDLLKDILFKITHTKGNDSLNNKNKVEPVSMDEAIFVPLTAKRYNELVNAENELIEIKVYLREKTNETT